MSLPASDNFDRANETPLAGNWTAPDGVSDSKFLLVGNGSLGHVEGIGASTLQLMYWNFDPFNTNHKSQAVLGGNSLSSASTYAGVGVRIQNSGQNGYLFGMFAGSGNGYKIQRIDSGSRTNLTNCTGTPTATDILRLEASGTTLTAYVNGSQVGQVTGESTYSGGAAGMFGYAPSGSFTLDDWVGDNLAAGVVLDWLPTTDSPYFSRKLRVSSYGEMPGRN